MNLTFNKEGLIPVITQDFQSKDVLMLGYMNQEAIDLTLKTKKVTYFSRSRQSLWVKGETSGHTQTLKSMRYDCDSDTVLIQVEQKGNVCHTGNQTCFFNEVYQSESSFDLLDLEKVVLERKQNPKEGSYTNYLFTKGLDKILKKVAEETGEVIIASKNNQEELIYEASDLIYHLTVLLVNQGLSFKDILNELKKRHQS